MHVLHGVLATLKCNVAGSDTLITWVTTRGQFCVSMRRHRSNQTSIRAHAIRGILSSAAKRTWVTHDLYMRPPVPSDGPQMNIHAPTFITHYFEIIYFQPVSNEFFFFRFSIQALRIQSRGTVIQGPQTLSLCHI